MQGGSDLTSASRAQPIEVYLDYHENDRDLLDKLEKYLGSLEDRIQIWHKGKTRFGTNRIKATREYLNRAEYVLILITQDYIDRYINNQSTQDIDNVFPQIQQKYQKGKVVIPVLLKSSMWDSNPFLNILPPLPRNKKHVVDNKVWQSEDEAFMTIAREFKDII